MIHPSQLLRWLYLGRLTLAGGLFGGALLVWRSTEPLTTLLVTLGLLLSLGVTLWSLWYTEMLQRRPGPNFLYGQSVFDTLLVTLAVHVTTTGAGENDFAPLYILVISAGALLLPLPGGMLIGALAIILYFADLVWLHPDTVTVGVFFQIGVFAAVALVTGYLGDRLRQTGTALGVVESELRQLRVETSDILGAIDAGVVTVDAAGRLAYLNSAAAALLGVSSRLYLGRPALEDLDRRAPGLGAALRRTLEKRATVPWVEARSDAAGGERILGVRTTVIERDGAPWATAVLQDVTHSRKLEELNRRAERLEAVAALSASLAHEIKNPLASIRSAVEQLARSRLSEPDREVLEALVVRESDRLSRLLSEFIEFSRVELRRRSAVDLGKVAAEAIALVEQHPDGDGVRIDFDAPSGATTVEGDEDLLHRAVFNLVLNGVQHAGPGGVVGVRVGRVGAGGPPAGVEIDGAACVAVHDTGPGVTPEIMDRIFDPFVSTRRGGTGLGLALVHRAVQAHGGAIIVENALGTGASFVVYLPALEEVAAAS